MRKIAATGIAAAASLALIGTGVGPAAADEMGTKSLASVLTADDGGFDKNGKDFDILTAAVLAVLAEKSDSPVSVLTDGSKAATAFVPNDRAFKILARQVSGKSVNTEKKAFSEIADLGIDTVETFLLYHVVAGATVDAATAVTLDDQRVTTALGSTFKVNVLNSGIRLKDKDRNSRNPRVIATDVNAGNMQIAHVIDRVLRPLDLAPVKH